MKAIKLSDSVILKEVYRARDKKNNTLQVTLEAECIFGKTYTKKVSGVVASNKYTINISEEKDPDLWDLLKDTSSDEFITEIIAANKEMITIDSKAKALRNKNKDKSVDEISQKDKNDLDKLLKDHDKKGSLVADTFRLPIWDKPLDQIEFTTTE